MIDSRRHLAITSLIVIAVMALLATVDAVMDARPLSWVLAIGMWTAVGLSAAGVARMSRT